MSTENQKAYCRKWHQRHKEEHNQQIKENSRKNAEWFKEYKSTLKCERCEENHPSCLEFHHKPGTIKNFNIGHMPRRYTKQRVLEEIEKCFVLCANCHRKEHW